MRTKKFTTISLRCFTRIAYIWYFGHSNFSPSFLATRTMLRLMWFCDFVWHLLRQLHEDRKKGISDSCKEAYNIALGPHHPFVVRTAAKVAMMAAPNRKNLMKILFPEDVDEEDRYKYIKEWHACIEKIKKPLWEYYEFNELTGLP